MPLRLQSVPLVLAVLGAGLAGAQPPATWTVEKRDPSAGWTLYSQPSPGSDQPLFRLVSRTDAPSTQVIQALQIKFRDDRYLPDDQTRVILDHGEGFLHSHLQIDAPFVSDRDTVVRVTWRTDEETGVHHLAWEPLADGAPPTARGVVRVVSRGSWKITPLPYGGSEIVYQTHNELGAPVPNWLIDRMLTARIIDELRVLEAILEQIPPDVAASVPPGN